MPLLGGLPWRDCCDCWESCDCCVPGGRYPSSPAESYPCSFLPAKLPILKLPGSQEKRLEPRLPERLGSLSRDALRLNPKLGRRLSVEGRGVDSTSEFGIAFFMLTGGYLRFLFSLVGCAASCCCCCATRFEPLRFITLSARLPSVLLRLWPDGFPCWCGVCGAWNWPPVRACSLTGRFTGSIAPVSEDTGPPEMIYPGPDFGWEMRPCAVVVVG